MAGGDTNPRPLRLVQNTDDYLVVHKEPGVAFHGQEQESGLVQILRAMEEAGEIPAGPRLFPVHRLDRVTSGLLVFARGRKNANLLGNEFRHGRVRKIYLAISDRSPKKKQGKIVGDMIRGRGGAWILARSTNNPAITRFLSYGIPGRRPGLRLYVLHPKTGRTHQLRVAMKSLAAPILGDGQYGRYDVARQEDRAYLHAYALRFQLGDETVECVSPPQPGAEFASAEFEAVLAEVKQSCKGDLFALFEKEADDANSSASGIGRIAAKPQVRSEAEDRSRRRSPGKPGRRAAARRPKKKRKRNP